MNNYDLLINYPFSFFAGCNQYVKNVYFSTFEQKEGEE